ncbi:MAG: DNA recombination protein RmuC [Phycisphaerales bacterium]|nr:MAG: DNA recombination protein RmuC [Phycisphaerales bacterium]
MTVGSDGAWYDAIMNWFLGGLIGFFLGGAIVGLVLWLRTQSQQASLKQRAASLDEQCARLNEELREARQNAKEADERRHASDVERARLEQQLQGREAQFEEQKKLLEEAEKKLLAVFEATGAKLLQHNTDRFMKQAEKSFDEKSKPIRELLEAQKKAVEEIEKKRETAYVRLDEQIKHIAQSHERLNTETNRLVTALRRPEQRGRWGELQLENVVQLAGMTEHCDFHTQAQTDDASTRDRPDMVVNLPGGGVIVVDAKVSLDAYLNAIQPDADREQELTRHARQVETHVRQLASKAYWNQFDRTPRLVVLFMPLESALHAALEIKPDLHAEAMKQNVLIATPTLLVATLRAIAYGWQQEAIAENARDIAAVGHELYDRLAKFTEHFERVGRGLNGATDSYNKAIGSLESRVLVSARRLRELHATTAKEIQSPPPLEIEVRDVTAPDLQRSAIEETGENASRGGA